MNNANAETNLEVVNCDLQPEVDASIQRRIFICRNVQVMIDHDLAELYGVEAKQLKRAVNRNIERFPPDFLFKLTKEDCVRCQIGTLHEINGKQGNWSTYQPYAFTESGIAMLSGILRSRTAIEANIRIMRAFVAMRHSLLSTGEIQQRIDQLQRQQIIDQHKNDERIDTLFSLFDAANLLPSGIFPAGTEFDAMRYVTRLIESAKTEIVLIDPYSDAVTLEVLAKKHPGVKVRLVCKDRGQPTATEIAKFNRQYKDLTVTYSDDFHDRFLIIDNVELHALGSSINSLGRRVTTYTSREPKEIAKLMSMLPS